MNIEKAIQMIDQYILSDCTDANWRNCLNYVRWLIIKDKELLDGLAKKNEYLRDEVKALIAGQETLQKYVEELKKKTLYNEQKIAVESFGKAGAEITLSNLVNDIKSAVAAEMSNQYCDSHHDATETAYKNGYEAGVREFAEMLKEHAVELAEYSEEVAWVCDIDPIANELIGGADE